MARETTAGAPGVVCHPFFLDSPQGPLFAVHHRPPEGIAVRGHVLCAAPFNEEMNRCRSMMTLQAAAWARLGYGTLVLDLLGTGDSAGGFVDARWSLWLDNLSSAMDWLDTQAGGCRVLWGLRLGAILATELHARRADPSVALALWQPVVDGKTHLTQFLRVKIAAQMDRADLPKETTAGMRAMLAAGHSVEVAGYELHPELTAAIDSARLADQRIPPGTSMLWLESAGDDGPELAPGSKALLARWPGADTRLTARTFHGPAFWQVHERVLAPEIIAIGSDWLATLGTTVVPA